MTRLLEQAIERLRTVPEAQQDRLAQFLLNELEEDDRWSASTAARADALSRLADRILTDDSAGVTEPLDPDKL